MTQNKTSRYLFYAIGEIVLVVIGILIALQINTWNAERVERQQEQTYLKSLRSDFEETRINISTTQRKQFRVVTYCNKLVTEMLQKNTNMHPDSLGEYIHRGAYSYWRIEPVNGTYDALVGSGQINVIQNKRLLEMLAKFSAEVKFGFEDEQMAVDLTTALVDKASPYSPRIFPKSLYEYVDFRSDPLSEKEGRAIVQMHMDNVTFLGNLIMKSGLEQNRWDYHQAMMKRTEDILAALDKEIQTENE